MVHNAPECPVHYAPVGVVQFAPEQLVHIAPVYSKRELSKWQKSSKGKSVADILETLGYVNDAFKTNEEISNDLEIAFNTLGISSKPVSTNIEHYFHARPTQRRRKEERVHGWVIDRKKGNL